MIVPDSERWKRISPLLDGLLDLDPDAREARLALLRAHDAVLARELASLIADAERAEASQFLAGSALARSVASGDTAPGLAGTTIGAYVLESQIGQGGMGAVWKARRADGRFEGRVAVKLLHLSLIGRTGSRRFEREGAILARLSHPHIARMLDAGVSEGGQPYLVLELVEGERIDSHCDSCRLGVDGRVALFREVLAAVAHAHRHLVIHRDIKPSNIMVTADGGVKLLDFGIAKLLQSEGDDPPTELTVGNRGALTPDYAAPEQLLGEEVTTATDVYSLGVLLYWLLSGQHPTAPPYASPADLMRTTLDTDPGRLSSAVTAGHGVSAAAAERIAAERDTSVLRLKRQLGGDLENIVAKALRKPPGERYATVDAFNQDLRRWASSEPVSARPDSFAYRAGRFVRRNRGKVAAGSLALTAIVAGLAGTITEARRAERQSELARQEADSARHERDVAVEQQRLQRGTAEFLQLLMRDAAGRDPGAIRKQLDRAVALLEQTRFEHPIVKVALLRQTAGRYAEIGEVAISAGLLRTAIASSNGSPSINSAVQVNLACSLARYLHEMDDDPGAAAEIDRADRLIATGAEVSLSGRIECMVQRSYIATALGDHALAVRLLRDSLTQLAAAGAGEGEQPRVVRSALSRALGAAGDHTAAMAIARPLLAESEAGQGRQSMAVLRRSSVVTALTRLGGDPLAALSLSEADRKTAAQLLGADRFDAALELEHGAVLLALDRYGEAAEAFARSASAAQAAGSLRYLLPAGLGETEALVRAGRISAANDRFAELALLRAKAAEPQRIESLRVAALLAAAHDDRSAARAALETAGRAIGPPSSTSIHPETMAIMRALGERAVADRRFDAEVFATVERAIAAAQHGALAPDRSSDVGETLLLRARLLALAGRNVEAQRDAATALRELATTLGSSHADTLAASALAAGS